MASGITHERINNALALPLVLGIIAITEKLFGGENVFSIVFYSIIGYVIGTFFLSPDLDILSRPYNRWGFLKFIWNPYQKLFSHRSFFTHSLVISDLIRVLYLSIFIAIVASLISKKNVIIMYYNILVFIATDQRVRFFLVGVILASAVHIITDYLSSLKNRIKK